MAILRIDTAEIFEPLLEPARYKGAYGGRSSGKSHFFADSLIDDCAREPGDSGGEGMLAVCIREIQKDLAQSAKRLIEKKLKVHGLGESQGFKIYKENIATPGDGIIIFKGMNDYTADSIKSLEGFKRGWWEEAHTATKHSLSIYRPTFRSDGAERWFSWNPRRKTDPVDYLFRGPDQPTNCVSVHVNWRANPFFPDESEHERQDCLRIAPEQYDHIWEGGYVTILEGAYYAKALNDAKAENRIGKVSADPNLTIHLFFDIGGTGARADAVSIWAAQFVGREIRVLNYYEAIGQPLATHLNWMREQEYKPKRAQVWLPHDGDTHDKVYDVSYSSAIKTAGYEVEVIPNQGKGAAKARIEVGRRYFPSIWFNEDTTQGGLDALGWYHEKKDEKRDIGLGPEHDWSSNAADSFGLMCIAADKVFKETKKISNPYGGLKRGYAA